MTNFKDKMHKCGLYSYYVVNGVEKVDKTFKLYDSYPYVVRVENKENKIVISTGAVCGMKKAGIPHNIKDATVIILDDIKGNITTMYDGEIVDTPLCIVYHLSGYSSLLMNNLNEGDEIILRIIDLWIKDAQEKSKRKG